MEYIAFETISGDLFVVTRRAALNMAHQGLTRTEGVIEPLATFCGSDIIGSKVKAPLAAYDYVIMCLLSGSL